MKISEGGINTDKNIVPIVFSADSGYEKYVPAVLQSIIDNASTDNHYNIIIFDCGMTPEFLEIIQTQIETIKNFSLCIKDLKKWLPEHEDYFFTDHYLSIATYARLAIPDLCGEYDKVIYADIDMIFEADTAALLREDMGDNYIAGVLDLVGEGERATKDTYRDYLCSVLGITEPLSYVNAGLLVFNISAWKREQLSFKAIEILRKHRLRHLDQDAINSVCFGRIHFLDIRWNYIAIAEKILKNVYSAICERGLKPLKWKIDEFYSLSCEKNFCYHYAAADKPWRDIHMPKALIWWRYAMRTDYYTAYILDLIGNNRLVGKPQEGKNEKKIYKILGVPLWWVRAAQSGKRYGIGLLRVAKTKKGRQNMYLYLFGVKIMSVKLQKK